MDIKALDEALTNIAEKKNLLTTLQYSDSRYDEVEDELHDLEDNLMENFGDLLEDVLYEVHDEYCPDNEVLVPTAYLAKEYIVSGMNGHRMFDVKHSEGVPVEADDFPGETRLVLVPSPIRILLMNGRSTKEVVWKP